MRSRSWLLGSVLFGLLAANITFTIFNVALVDIAHGMRTSEATLTWAVTGPLLAIGVTAPTLGKLGDLYGHRRLYLWGLAGSLVCAALTAAAWNAPSLIVARLFSGLGSAALTASSWSLLFRAVGQNQRAQVLGWWSLVSAGGPVIGVAAGGPVVQSFGWRWVFVAQVPLIVVSLVASFVALPETDRSAGEPLDVAGAVTLALGVGALLFALNRGSEGWTRPVVIVAVAVGVAGLAVFWRVERRAESPVFPLDWLGRRDFSLPFLAGFAMNFAYMGGFFLTPLFLEQGLRYGIGETGLLQIARPLVFAIAAPAAGYLAVRTGERSAAAAGAGFLIVSMLMFAVLVPSSGLLLIILALSLSGLANGVATPSISALVANAAEAERMGTASAALQVASQIGVVAGIQVMQTVQASRLPIVGTVGSFHEAYLVGAAVTVVSVVAAVLMRAGRRPIPVLAATVAPGGLSPAVPPIAAVAGQGIGLGGGPSDGDRSLADASGGGKGEDPLRPRITPLD